MPNVNHIRKELSIFIALYNLIRDVIAGETVVKEKKDEYLPRPNSSDLSEENRARYDAYIKRAVFYNVARRTLLGLVGQIFSREPAIKVNTSLDPILANATGTGVSLVQLAKIATEYCIAYSRCGIFVDYPTTSTPSSSEGGVTIEQLKKGSIRPTLYCYAPWEIINWRTVDKGAEEVISLIVLKETYPYEDDGFEIKEAIQYRVLRLNEEGNYIQQIWREKHPTDAEAHLKLQSNYEIWGDTIYPLDAAGNNLKEIPFRFIGSKNNDTVPENPNFYDICSLNVAHYRNSADYEEACYILGQPTPVITGLTEDWFNDVLKGSVNFGSRGGIPLPVGANAELLQADENKMIKEAMETKERQMVALGAKLVEQSKVQRTATEASMENASETSVLSSISGNVSTVFLWALKFASAWNGIVDETIEFKLNDDFDLSKLSNEQRAEVVKEWQSGAITFKEMRSALRKAGIATEDDNAAKKEIEADKEKQAELEAKKSPALKK